MGKFSANATIAQPESPPDEAGDDGEHEDDDFAFGHLEL
jgi:hypothetical protein